MTGRRLAWPAARTGRDGGGATGEEEPSRRRGGGRAGGGMSRFDIGGPLRRGTGELSKTIGDPFSGSESSITMASDPWDPNIRGRGPATGLLATSPASSESANNQARLSSASHSFVLGAASWSEASLLGAKLPKYGSGATTASNGAIEGELGGDGEMCSEARISPDGREGDEYLLGEGDLEGAADVQISIIDWSWTRGMSGDDERMGAGEGLGGGECEFLHRPISISISFESSTPLRENWLGLGSGLPASTRAFVRFRVACRFLPPSTVVLARLSLVFGGFVEVADVEAARLGTNNPASISSSVSSSKPASSSNLVIFFRLLPFCFTRRSETLTKPVQAPGGTSRVGSSFRLRFLLGSWAVLLRDFSVVDRSYSSISIIISRH